MANRKHLEILQQGVGVWNKWRRKNPHILPDLIRANLIRANLSGANFSGAYLRGTYLRGADLIGANLSGAYLGGANLFGACLGGANLSGAHLIRADLSGADLGGADLSEADLSGAHLSGADLSGADLSEAELCEADLSGTHLSGANMRFASISRTAFGDVDLSEVEGLETIVHFGPPIIGVDTIFKSGGNIPRTFLKKSGIPQKLIDYIPSVVGKPWEFYSCFISYSNKDQEFADRLYVDLQNNGVRCWLAPEHLEIGDRFRQVIDQVIRTFDKILLIFSENSINSKGLEDEVESAFEKERKRKEIVLFPIRLDDVVMHTSQPWAEDIRRVRYIGDFTNWKDPDEYQNAFERLVQDLNATPQNKLENN